VNSPARASWQGRERPVRDVPLRVLALLGLALAAQITLHGLRPAPEARAAALPSPADARTLAVAALGEPVALAKALMLWLQAFDNQPGISIPFRDLDYGRVEGWLARILALDPRGQYPLLAASRLYGEVPVPEKQRVMLDFVHRAFLEDPERRWPWLAHAAIVARHRLSDLPLALIYARAITDHATGPTVPGWARDLSVLVLEEMGELEAARVLIGGLLDSGRVQDPHEVDFLDRKLRELEARPDEISTGR
jgi:hypothetical protein